MKIITGQQIKALNLSPATCVEWAREAFALKRDAAMPAKISVHPKDNDFFTAMPCLLPGRFDTVALKMVRKVSGAVPALSSDIYLYRASTGGQLAMMDGDRITAMRTGAVAALAAQTLRRSGDIVYSMVGLGNIAVATLLCLLSAEPDISHKVLLKSYKDQAERFIGRFIGFSNVEFEVVGDIKTMIASSDVIFSCITAADGLFCEDESCFRPGCTLIPVHVRGFENCDLFFDKVIGDDTDQLKGWRYFDRYRYFAEISDVLAGSKPGRVDDSERILSYNYGIAVQDALFAYRIFEALKDGSADAPYAHETEKFWL